MTFDDDFLQVNFAGGGFKRIRLLDVGMSWPPAPVIVLGPATLHRISMSEISDAQRAKITHVCRGALYAEQPHGAPVQ